MGLSTPTELSSATTAPDNKMNRRLLLTLPIQVAPATEGIATSAHAQTPQATPKPAGPPNPFSRTMRSSGMRPCACLARTSMAPAHSARFWRYPGKSRLATATAGMTLGTPPATAWPDKPMASSRGGTRSAPGTITFARPTIIARQSFSCTARRKTPGSSGPLQPPD
jgi:hypothetical protein